MPDRTEHLADLLADLLDFTRRTPNAERGELDDEARDLLRRAEELGL